jgi:predicted alpha/beta-fold hydrolase
MSDFEPLPFLANAHLQTVIGNVLKGPLFEFPSRERHVRLPDGDQLALHDSIPARWRPGGRIAILVHGLGGSHRSPYMGRFADLLLPAGFRVVRMDLRGAGRGLGLARRSYHGGCSDDLRAAIAEVLRWSPSSPLSLIGVSLGGNIVLKLAGETVDYPVPNLERVAALAPPIDLVRCAALLAEPRNRLYEINFLRDLTTLLQRRRRYFPDLPPVRLPKQLTMRVFDDEYTAPQHGFDDALDYYRKASALPVVADIPMPALVMTARDDPFIAVESFESLRVPDHIHLRILPRGGHIGFLGWDGSGGIRWAERRIAEWVART